MTNTFSLAIHGGAGTMRAELMTEASAASHRAGLRVALLAGHDVLARGGTAVDAVTQAVTALEDDLQFNAGRGAVFTSGGQLEMDAAIMDGDARTAGAVAGVLGPRNPILAARVVMERSGAVMMIGEGAIAFCRAEGVRFEDAAYFHTGHRWDALQAELARRSLGVGDAIPDDAARHGTVGAVARDRAGHLAAATSTGGMTGKRPGRVGDCPVFGAGTWADRTCAVSATGTGEVFIRHGAAHEIAARVRLGGQTLEAAAADVIAELLADGGDGGLIAVDANGRVTLPFNSKGMYRGVIDVEGVPRTAIYQEALAD